MANDKKSELNIPTRDEVLAAARAAAREEAWEAAASTSTQEADRAVRTTQETLGLAQ
jgi:hypothetical protein